MTAFKKWFDFQDLLLCGWLCLLQPVTESALSAMAVGPVPGSRVFMVIALAINYCNLFLLGFLLEKRYIAGYDPDVHGGGFFAPLLEILLNPSVLVLLNGIVTISVIGYFLSVLGVHNGIIVTVVVVLLAGLFAGLGAMSRKGRRRVFEVAGARPMGLVLLKELLAVPVIIAGVEFARSWFFRFSAAGWVQNTIFGYLLLFFIAGPVLWFGLVFMVRSASAISVPQRNWLWRYIIFLGCLLFNGFYWH